MNTPETDFASENKKKARLIMGSEGKGISADIINYIDNKLYIPEYPLGVRSSESLNVAVATSIICSEFRRRSLSK